MHYPYQKLFCTAAGLTALLGAVNSRADTINLPVSAETFLFSGAPDHNAGAHAWFDAGADGHGDVRRGLARFNLSGIPAGSVINAATVQFTVTKVPAAGAVDSTFDLIRLTAAWNEGNKSGNGGSPATAGEPTWNARQFGASAWTTAGARADAAASASASTAVSGAGAYSWSSPALAADVQFWLDNPAQNFGWLLVSQDEASFRSVRGFAARENGASAGTLQIDYTPLIVPNVPPTVAITSPANGATFNTPASVTIEAAAADSDGTVAGVAFYDGATLLGSDSTDPYSLTVNFFPGTNRLTAVATDNLGATTTSLTVTTIVTAVVITNPIPERVPKGDLTIELRTIADGMSSPLGLAAPDDGSGRLFVYDQPGVIWVVNAGGRRATPLLDLRGLLIPNARYDYDERGLLGVAVHPNFAANPLIYTYTSETNAGPADFPASMNVGTLPNHQSVITEWRIDAADSNRVDVASRREVLRIDKPQSNHNGGVMRFGPDGFLYFTLGDGGSANDVANGHVPGGNAQSTMSILGKLHRIDVDTRNAANGKYGIPLDNPFDGVTGLREIYAYGLRNPFSISFDRADGTCYVADVGQNRVEEINIITKGGNYGWNVREASFWFNPAGGVIVTAPVRPPPPNLIDPIAMYDHDDGLAIIGGAVYRGSAIPALQGRYVCADWGAFNAPSGRLYYLDANNIVTEFRLGVNDRPFGYWIKGIGEGPDGELYVFASRVVGPAGNTGTMLKLVPAPKPISFTSITSTNGTNVAEVWCGGMGPFALQAKANLSDPAWVNVRVSTQTNAVIPADGRSGFFRVTDTARQPAIPLSVSLSGLAERPTPHTNSGTGFGLLSLDGNTLNFNLRYGGLSGIASAAHFHGPAATTNNAPVLIDLAPFNGGAFGSNGTLAGQIVLSDAHKAMFLAGQIYVNVHTAARPGGEIRGQVAPVLFQTSLNGANERPTPRTTPALGLGELALVGDQLTFNITYRGLPGPATAAHFHGPSSPSQTAGVLIDLAPFNGGSFGTNGTLAGTITLTSDQIGYFADSRIYVNIHSATFPGGEIRGQVVPQTTAVPLTAALTGLSERPTPITNSAAGSAILSLEGSTLNFSINYSNLSGVATAAHFHGPATSTNNAGVLIDLAPFRSGAFGVNGTFSGSINLSPTQRDTFLSSRIYVNVHTGSNPGGEIRGQVAPVLMRSYLSGAEERATAVVSPGSGLGTFALVLNRLALAVTYGGLPGTATASHIHGPAGINQTAGVLVDLAPFNGGTYGTSGSMVGTATLTPTQLGNIIDQLTYLNIHTSANPGGELRGQLTR